MEIEDTQGFDPVTRNPITIASDPNGPLVALAFKVQIDKYVGRLVYIRVYSGTL